MAVFGWNNPLSTFGGNNYGGVAQAVMQNCFMPIEVRDETEAQSYPVAANTTVMLICYPANRFWMKSTNANGTVVSFRTFNFAEEVKEEPKYITKSDLEAFKKELLESIKGGNAE